MWNSLGLDPQHGDTLAWVCTLIVSLLTFGHLLAGVPLERLGENNGGGIRTRLWGYDSSRGEFPHFAAFFLVICVGMIAYCLLRPWPIFFFLLAARVFWYNRFARMTSKPPPPRQGKQVLNETAQFPKELRQFDELHK